MLACLIPAISTQAATHTHTQFFRVILKGIACLVFFQQSAMIFKVINFKKSAYSAGPTLTPIRSPNAAPFTQRGNGFASRWKLWSQTLYVVLPVPLDKKRMCCVCVCLCCLCVVCVKSVCFYLCAFGILCGVLCCVFVALSCGCSTVCTCSKVCVGDQRCLGVQHTAPHHKQPLMLNVCFLFLSVFDMCGKHFSDSGVSVQCLCRGLTMTSQEQTSQVKQKS